MFEIYVLGVIIRGGMFVLENKDKVTLSSDSITSTIRCGLQWPVDVYDSLTGN